MQVRAFERYIPLETGDGEGESSEPHEPPLDPPL